MDEAPLDVWSAVQDCWLRLGVICPAAGSILDDSFQVVFANARALDWGQDAVELIDLALNQRSYRWCHQGRQGDLAQFVEMRGNDLVVVSSSFAQIDRWPNGQELVCLIKDYLLQIRTSVTAIYEATAHAPHKFPKNIQEGLPS